MTTTFLPGDRVRYLHTAVGRVWRVKRNGQIEVILDGRDDPTVADRYDLEPESAPVVPMPGALVLACGHVAAERERLRPGSERWCSTCMRWENVR